MSAPIPIPLFIPCDIQSNLLDDSANFIENLINIEHQVQQNDLPETVLNVSSISKIPMYIPTFSISLIRIIDLIQKNPSVYSLEGPQRLRFCMDFSDINKRLGINEAFQINGDEIITLSLLRNVHLHQPILFN